MSKIQERLLLFSWGIAFIATIGSLFFSEVMEFEPCELCWMQRILMYPLVVILGTAYVKKEIYIAIPGFILSLIGAPLALYHYIIQKIDTLSSPNFCGDISCTVQYINYFGFITIPFLSLVAFTSIIVLFLFIFKGKGGVV